MGLFYLPTYSTSHKGTSHWRHQRLSALVLIPLGIWLLIGILRHIHVDYLTVYAWVAQPSTMVVLTLFVGLVFYHSTLGLQVIIEDYISQPSRQVLLITQVKIVNFIMAITCWGFIIRIALIGKG
jgi:succinate dehydrogenase / fumarate reductase membrane anchor subunit